VGRVRLYEFRSLNMPILTGGGVRQILKAKEDGVRSLPLTFNLGLSKSMVELLSDEVVLEGHHVSYEELRQAASDEDELFVVEPPGRLRRAVLYAGGRLYKLRSVGEEDAPTLEVNGVALHRIQDTKPWVEASMKVEAAGIKQGAKVLDICTGLGYTAIQSLMRGASEVWTVEEDVNVLRMAEMNPWSKGLESPRVKKVLSDAAEALAEFKDEEFEVIIHDPPSMSQASKLYSMEFYQELYRLLKKGGVLSHFVGPTVSRSRGMDSVLAVSRRLKNVGFTTKINREVVGVTAVKEG
jgi:predicted methyltransferase